MTYSKGYLLASGKYGIMERIKKTSMERTQSDIVILSLIDSWCTVKEAGGTRCIQSINFYRLTVFSFTKSVTMHWICDRTSTQLTVDALDWLTSYQRTHRLCLFRADDYVSAPFRVEKLKLYKDGDNADKFFRPALRSLLVNNQYLFIIIN